MKYFGTPIKKSIGIIEDDRTLYFNGEDLVEVFGYESLEHLLKIVPENFVKHKFDLQLNRGYTLVTIEGFYISAINSSNEKAKNMIKDFLKFVTEELDRKDIDVDDINF